MIDIFLNNMPQFDTYTFLTQIINALLLCFIFYFLTYVIILHISRLLKFREKFLINFSYAHLKTENVLFLQATRLYFKLKLSKLIKFILK